MFHIQWVLASPQSPCEMVDSCPAILQADFNRGNQLQHKSPLSRCKWTPWKILMKTNVWCPLLPRDAPQTICSCSGLTLWQLQPIGNTNVWPAGGNKARLLNPPVSNPPNQDCTQLATWWICDSFEELFKRCWRKTKRCWQFDVCQKICPCVNFSTVVSGKYGDECLIKTF